ncbi:hypothetical protein D3C84_1216880 [compost metagenome]
MLMAADGKSFFVFPPLDGRDVPSEVVGYGLPRIQPAARDGPHALDKRPFGIGHDGASPRRSE